MTKTTLIKPYKPNLVLANVPIHSFFLDLNGELCFRLGLKENATCPDDNVDRKEHMLYLEDDAWNVSSEYIDNFGVSVILKKMEISFG